MRVTRLRAGSHLRDLENEIEATQALADDGAPAGVRGGCDRHGLATSRASAPRRRPPPSLPLAAGPR
jgi:hypothetical protein